MLNSGESKLKRVQDYFQHYLGRLPSPTELITYTRILDVGGTGEDVIARILISSEYLNRAGGTNRNFVRQIFIDVLGRAASASEEQDLTNQLNTFRKPSSRLRMCSHQHRVSSESCAWLLSKILRRPATDAEVTNLVNFLNGGGTGEQVIAQLLGSAEYLTLLPASGFSTVEGATGQVTPASFFPENTFITPGNISDRRPGRRHALTPGTATQHMTPLGEQFFRISFPHSYADPGAYNIIVTPSFDGVLGTPLNTIANVAEFPLLTTSKTISAVQGTPFTGDVATFLDDTGGVLGDPDRFTATIDWGDGSTPTTGTITTCPAWACSA